MVRYRRLVDQPEVELRRICDFLGVSPDGARSVPGSNVKQWAPDGVVNRLLRPGIRVGATLGAHVHPQVWRQAQRPLLQLLQRGDAPRARLTAEAREALLPHFVEDVHLLSDLLGEDYTDWLTLEGRGTYTVRRS